MVRDITRERQAEKRLAKARCRACRIADRRKDEFLATLAHELRNPLAPLSNVLEIWKRSSEPRATRQARARRWSASSGQMVRLVDDLLDLNRITHNRLELRSSARRARDGRSEHAVETCRPLADRCGHELTRRRCRQSRSYLRRRPGAARAGVQQPAQQRVQVHGRAAARSRSRREQRRTTTSWSASKTTASGIPPDLLERVFDMFTQVGPSLEHGARRARHRPHAREAARRRCTAAPSRRRAPGSATAASSSCGCRCDSRRDASGNGDAPAAGVGRRRALGASSSSTTTSTPPISLVDAAASSTATMTITATTAPRPSHAAEKHRPDVDAARHRPADA